MRKSALASFALVATVICAFAGQKPASREKSGQIVTLRWLGTAGWEISDGTTVILIDPYVSRIWGPQPPGRAPYARTPGDTRPVYGWDDVATPDAAAIEAHVQRAD
ncbi:MAG TPA: hypothetical protein VIX11_13180, partial [Candidatus Acidoferrum sp.]